MIDPRNRWLLYRGSFAVWLHAAPEVLGNRIGRSANVRPLIAGRDPIATLRDLAAARERFYAPALEIGAGAPAAAIVRAHRRARRAEAGTARCRCSGPTPPSDESRSATPTPRPRSRARSGASGPGVPSC